MDKLPAEVIQNIFSYLPWKEICKVGSVCRQWRCLRGWTMIQCLQDLDECMHVCSTVRLNSDSTIKFRPASYDAELDALEFKPVDQERCLPFKTGAVRIVLKSWSYQMHLHRDIVPNHLTPVQRAQYLFHHQYAPLYQRLYILPNMPETIAEKDEVLQWMGDVGMGILALVRWTRQGVQIVSIKVSLWWVFIGTRPTLEGTDLAEPDNPIAQAMLSTIQASKIDYSFVQRHAFTNWDTFELADQEHRIPISLFMWKSIMYALKDKDIDLAAIWKYTSTCDAIARPNPAVSVSSIVDRVVHGEQQWRALRQPFMEALEEESPNFYNRIMSVFKTNKTPAIIAA